MGIFGIVASLLGALGFGSILTLVVKHYLDKKKYNVSVQVDKLDLDKTSYEFQRQQITDLISSMQDLKSELADEKVLRAEQEGKCDEKIAKLNRIVDGLRKDMARATRRCDNNCFASSDAA